MSRRSLDEREHRRGLVLGLTLAEILLLFLFLLILGLGDRLRKAEANLRAIDVVIQNWPGGAPSVADIAKYKADIDQQRRDLAPLAPALDQARKINPNDPVAVLVRAINRSQSEDAEISALKSKLESAETLLRSIEKPLQEARRQRPKDPAGLLMELMEKARTDSPPQPVALPPAQDGPGQHNWPPIITLSEASGHYYESGSSELSETFRAMLRTLIAGKLLSTAKAYGADVIEVIGHTDEQPLPERRSNLDRALLPVIQAVPKDAPLPGDNAGLGLARAVAVVRELAGDERFAQLKLIPLSAGPLVELGDRLSAGEASGSIRERRRIEIRVRRSSNAATETAKCFDTRCGASIETGSPASAEQLAVDGDSYLLAGKWSEALQKFDTALTVNPRYALAHLGRGIALHKLKDYAQALRSFTATIENDPRASRAWLGRGIAKFDSGDFKGATSDLDRAIAIENNAQALFYRVLAQNRIQTPGLKRFGEQLAALKLPEGSAFRGLAELYLSNDLSRREQVRAVVRSEADRCIVEFYIGQYMVNAKRIDDAKRSLTIASTICDLRSSEYHTAHVELQRMREAQ